MSGGHGPGRDHAEVIRGTIPAGARGCVPCRESRRPSRPFSRTTGIRASVPAGFLRRRWRIRWRCRHRAGRAGCRRMRRPRPERPGD
ncbi:hypothetical protein B7R87_29650 [Streptomyces tsukubensis]|nr:hypothetical protein B7R87_29650 [Streptomyces tsukubensis]